MDDTGDGGEGVMLLYGFQVGHLILGGGEPGMVELTGDGKPLFGMPVLSGANIIPFEYPFEAEHFVLTVPKGWPVFVPEGVEVVVREDA